MTDKEFLTWIYERMTHVHNENPNVDYMLKFKDILDKMTDVQPHDKMHVYVFMADEDGELIAELWTCSVPDIDERLIIWSKEGFKNYTLKHRIYGANTDEKCGVWNLYVEENHPDSTLTDEEIEELRQELRQEMEKISKENEQCQHQE